jgi:hypothetical protein
MHKVISCMNANHADRERRRLENITLQNFRFLCYSLTEGLWVACDATDSVAGCFESVKQSSTHITGRARQQNQVGIIWHFSSGSTLSKELAPFRRRIVSRKAPPCPLRIYWFNNHSVFRLPKRESKAILSGSCKDTKPRQLSFQCLDRAYEP